jgi:hypothetical protein
VPYADRNDVAVLCCQHNGDVFAYALRKKPTIYAQSVNSVVCPDGVSGPLMTLLASNDGVQ